MRTAKVWSVTLVLLCEIGAMSVWFASGAVLALLPKDVAVTPAWAAWLTGSVQLGFVAGTLVSAALSLADRYDPRRLFSICAILGAGATAALAFIPPDAPAVLPLRFFTGACMAGVYPVGIRLVASWARDGGGDMGLLIGLLVGALTLGAAAPHLAAIAPAGAWREVYVAVSVIALASGLAINAARLGPNRRRAQSIDLRRAVHAWRDKALRLANLGYLGHMWELYAMWAWIAAFFAASFGARQMAEPGRMAEWATLAVVGVGAIGAAAGGFLADRIGRTALTIAAMATSCACALAMGWLEGAAPWLVVGVGLIWGFTIIADSAQFSAVIAELSPPDSVGTLLTVQTCLGFLLTLGSIRLTPVLVDIGGWPLAFTILAVGPLLGCVAMARLRRHPDAVRIAGGRR